MNFLINLCKNILFPPALYKECGRFSLLFFSALGFFWGSHFSGYISDRDPKYYEEVNMSDAEFIEKMKREHGDDYLLYIKPVFGGV